MKKKLEGMIEKEGLYHVLNSLSDVCKKKSRGNDNFEFIGSEIDRVLEEAYQF